MVCGKQGSQAACCCGGPRLGRFTHRLSAPLLQNVVDDEQAKQAARLGKKMTAPKAFPRVALDLATTVERIQQNFVIADPNLPDCPIVFASDGFLELTEFARHEVLGRNCR